MKKILLALFLALAILLPMTTTSYAQSRNAYRYNYDYDYDRYDSDAEEAIAMVVAMWFIFLPIILGTYVYYSFTLMRIAQKLDDPSPWFAWIPVLSSILQLRLGEKNPFLLFLLLIPFFGPIALLVITVLAYMRICERLGRDKYLGLLKLCGWGEVVLLGVLAWSKDSSKK
ncbi:MAG: hypothetical protein ACOX6Q_01630 [Candidatus Dojkabacteria bacterium]|jgi:ABC-type Na+ efflux pump permease subunit